MTLSKLSLRNARRQARDYLVYFVTIVMSAAFLYAFNGLIFSKELQNLSAMMASLPLVVVLASIVVVCIIGWLVSYTTKFMLKKRSRELGTYILIGLENRQVAGLFFMENLLVGMVALVFGVLLGNLIFQGIRAVTLSLFNTTYHFSFTFSIESVGLTLLYFAIIYLFALLKSRRTIKKMKIYDLIYYERQNEEETIHKERTRQRLFVFSIICGIIGTLLILQGSLEPGLLGSALIIFFLYGFFISFSSGIPAYFHRRPQKKYKGYTLLVFRTLAAKLSTMGVVMATIALLFTATIITEGSGLIFSILFQERAEQTTCFDLFIASVDREDEAHNGHFGSYSEYIDNNIPVRDFLAYPVYLSDSSQVLEYVEENADYWRIYDSDTLMKASDYISLREMLGYPPAEIKPGQYLIHCMDYMRGVMEGYNQPINIRGSESLTPGKVYSEIFTQSLWDGNGRGYILVVPDEVLSKQPINHWAYGMMTSEPVSEADYNELLRQRNEKDTKNGYDTIFSKAAAESESAVLCATVVFPLYYIALVLTMTAATILTIHQLSETGRYRRQFTLLRSLGMDAGEMRRALKTQFALFYAMPAIPPVMIGIPFVSGLGNALDPGILDGIGVWVTVGVSLAMFFGIYLIYIIASYSTLNRSVFQD